MSSIAPLRIKGQLEFNREIAAFLDSGVNSKAPIQIDENGKFVYGNTTNFDSANLYMVISDEDARKQQGTWNVIDGEVDNADILAKHTYLLIPALQSEQNDADDLVEINGSSIVSPNLMVLINLLMRRRYRMFVWKRDR